MSNESIKVLIVDDEPIARDILALYVEKIPSLALVAKSKNAIEAFQHVSTNKVDILLLDINMPEISGINFLKTLKDPPWVIFTTAYTDYAVESYEYNTIDYLLKPISFERFLKAIDKATDIITNKNHVAIGAVKPDNTNDILFIKSDGKLVKLELKKLWFVEGLKDYITLWTETGKIIVHSTMKSFEENLRPYSNFIRVHKSYIVNLQDIDEVEGNTIRIKKQEVLIGATYRDEVFKRLHGFRRF